MNSSASLPLLVVIAGPTASGKSTLGVWLAEKLGGEIVACDSTQLYQGFDIGTAKPTAAERRGIPHHLLDVLAADRPSTAGGYREMAVAVLDELQHRGRVPVITAGTGLYLRALLEGLADLPERSEELRKRLQSAGQSHAPGYLHRILQKLDRIAAGKIAATDEQKIIRAVEVCILARKPLTELHREGRNPLTGWRVVKLGLLPPREALYERIHKRTNAMLTQGWLEEVRGLLGSGLDGNAKPFDFIGYRELRSVVRGEMSLADARAAIQQSTRQYAKRQLTWFRRDPEIHWLPGFGDDASLQSEALLAAKQFADH